MKLITDRPDSFQSSASFICMGIVEDSGLRYAVFVDAATGQVYIEEMYMDMGMGSGSVHVKLRSVENDQEWKALYRFVTEKTRILSPKKLKQAIQIARSRGVVPKLDGVIQQNFPYAHRKVDDKTFDIRLPKE